MTTETQEPEQDQSTEAPKQEFTEERNTAVTHLANKMLGNVNLSEALSLVPLGQIINLVQQQVIQQAKKQVEDMSDEEIKKAIEEGDAALAEAQAQAQAAQLQN
tara:strand:- start:307 stop:618 length:312 start_codon:yes stop_codon:yes gene_type:complete